ncbi:hypothetical protein SDC9_34169 [bioreactor metagenome]|uniref:Uncharacterized protein n=1 Tax=bioreactor metagenome TaxID=1076179 RepID=A0A644VBK9_9ZZZZ
MLYKYLFYSVSYIVKKYDRLWRVGDVYFISGAFFVGIIIAAKILSLLDIFGFLIYKPLIWQNYKILAFLPLTFGILSCIYFAYKRRCDKIYTEIENMDKNRKRKYKIINIIHVILVLSIYFMLGDIGRELNVHDGPAYTEYLIRVLGIKYE